MFRIFALVSLWLALLAGGWSLSSAGLSGASGDVHVTDGGSGGGPPTTVKP